jgi:hypothetical protein
MVQHMVSDSVSERGCQSMEEVRKEELEEQRVELLPDREEMHRRLNLFSQNVAIAVQGSTANAGNVFVIAD